MKKFSAIPQKEKPRLAIIGFGRLGRACAKAILADEKLELAGFVRRLESLGGKLPPPFAEAPAVAHVTDLGEIDAALVCVPTLQVLEVARGLLQHRIPIVECAILHEEDFRRHKKEIDRHASNYESSAIVGAGWDPGALSLIRGLFTLLIPRGHSETSYRPGVSLHHSSAARHLPGVKDALSTELFGAEGSKQRYIYVELEKGADAESVKEALLADPLFIDEETLFFPVKSLSALEEEGHGILLERREAAAVGHSVFLLEGRYSQTTLAARIMVSAARAVPTRHHRAYSLYDLPQRVLWGELHEMTESKLL